MLERICDKNVLIGFAKALADRGFKPGFDSMTADALVIWLEINGDGLARDLLSGRYKPLPAIGTNIAKKHGGYRRIVRLTALDTVIQQAHSFAAKFEPEHDSIIIYRYDRFSGLHIEEIGLRRRKPGRIF